MSLTRVKISIFFLIILLAVSAFGQKRITEEPRPKWVDNPPAGVYVGISHQFTSEADARTDAVNNAKRKIIESLGVIIESELVDQLIESSSNPEMNDATIDSKIKVISKSVIAVEPQEIFIEEWKHKSGMMSSEIKYLAFVAVPFSKSAHEKFIQDLVTESIETGKSSFNDAMTLAKSGQVFLSIGQFRDAIKSVSSLKELTGLPPMETAKIQQFINQINQTVNQIENGVRITAIHDNQKAKLGMKIPEPLVIKAFCQINGEEIPLPGLPVKFQCTSGKADLSPTAITMENGEAACNVYKVNSGQTLKIEATLTLPEDYPLEELSHLFTLPSDNRVIVKILEKNGDSPVEISYTENKLLEMFNNIGFMAVDNDFLGSLNESNFEQQTPEQLTAKAAELGADLIIIGNLKSGQVNQIREGYYFARSSGSLKVFNVSQKMIVGNYLASNVKVAGNSPENAGSKSLQQAGDQMIEKMFTELQLK